MEVEKNDDSLSTQIQLFFYYIVKHFISHSTAEKNEQIQVQ